MYALVREKKTSMFMLTRHKFVLKNPRPLGFTDDFLKKCLAYWVFLKIDAQPTLVKVGSLIF